MRYAPFLALYLAGLALAADVPEMTPLRKDVKPFEYVEAKVPFYPAGERWGTIGKPMTRMQLPLDPAESMKHMVHPVGFELKLFAAEPNLGGKPIAMAWDERGRLWVAVTVDYPNELKPEGQGRDRIVICADTDGDEKADKFTVFADKLSIPTGLTFARGGVIVSQAPHFLFLKDMNGDDVADERKVLFTGWSTSDTHAGPSNLQYGPDNWIWGMTGYAGFEGRVGGERHSFRQGFYRFRPDGSKLEFIRSTNNNTWGLGFSEEGLAFGSTANGCPSVFMPIPNRSYEAVRGWSPRVLQSIADSNRYHPITEKVRQVDYHGGFTAAAGHALYTARTYPKEYWNRTAFVTEPTGHLAATFVLEPQGAGFRARYGWNLLASDDEWTAPTMAEVGPDGCVWIIDWYNYIVQHNPTPPGYRTGRGAAYETELRDKKHGRIYRLVAKPQAGSKPQAAPKTVNLKNAALEELVACLKNDNMLWRKHAQRLLVERGKKDVVPELIKLVNDPAVDETGLNVGAIHALWTLHGLGALEGSDPAATAAVSAALKHPSAGVRRNAAGVLPRNDDGLHALVKRDLLSDADAQVRLSALVALSEMRPHPLAAGLVFNCLKEPVNNGDRWLLDAATCAAATHAEYLLLTIALSGKAPLPDRLEGLVAIVAEHHARGKPVDSIGWMPLNLAGADVKWAEVILAGLAKGWPKDTPVQLPAGSDKTLSDLFARLSPAGQGNLIRLTTLWGSKGLEKHGAQIAQSLLKIVTDEKQAEDARVSAARQLVELTAIDADSVDSLLAVLSPRTGPALAAGVIGALEASQSPRVGPAILERFNAWPPSLRKAGVQVLLRRPESTRALLEALDKGTVQLDELALDQRQALASHPDRRIAGRAKKLLERGGGLPNADRQKVIEELLPLVKKPGDPALGKEVFKKHCANCHRHGTEGNHIGPDLSGMAAHTKEHLLAEILDPNRNVEGNFRVYTVATNDDRVLVGLLASESKTSIELIDAEAKRHVLQRTDVDQVAASTKSLMPEGFEKQLKEQELANMLEFLTQRGKFLPLPLDRVATIVSTRGMFNSEESPAERLVFDDWSPKTVGDVPFHLIDPQGDRRPNVILLYGPQGKLPPTMPKSVRLACNAPAKAIHLLSGVSGWGYPLGEKGSVSMIVRLHYSDGKTEEHELKNGVHFADYIRRVDVPESQFAFTLRGRQIRHLAVTPKRAETITHIEFAKGDDRTAPVVMAVTVELP